MAGRPMTNSLSFVAFLKDPPKGLLEAMEQEAKLVEKLDKLQDQIRKARETAVAFIGDITPNAKKAAIAACKAEAEKQETAAKQTETEQGMAANAS